MQGSHDLWDPSTLSPDMSLPHLGRAHINNCGTALIPDLGRTGVRLVYTGVRLVWIGLGYGSVGVVARLRLWLGWGYSGSA
jgi:hypothetical protein